MHAVKLLRLSKVPILRQLLLEEALLRADNGNWCIINDGTSIPAIVMGISGKPQELINVPAAQENGIQVIKRFSGGGTVVTDENTIFATVILQTSTLPPDVECYPRPLMRWSESLYAPVFSPYGRFNLQENDYCFGDMKFGGNAQAITKQRFLHHTSLLWDYQSERMQLLKHPAKIPDYRADRDHMKFVCKLKDYVLDREHLLDNIPGALEQAGLTVKEAELSDAEKFLEKDYFKNTKLVELMSGQHKTFDMHTATGSIAPGTQRTVHPPGSQN
ncbi:hypothetical protein ABBQ32_012766 [Trebouxia sp. C0010 RCD-2024]